MAAVDASSFAVPPAGPACAFAATTVAAKTAAETGSQDFNAMMISCAVTRRWFWEEHASCAPTRPCRGAGVDPALPANPRKLVPNSKGCGGARDGAIEARG